LLIIKLTRHYLTDFALQLSRLLFARFTLLQNPQRLEQTDVLGQLRRLRRLQQRVRQRPPGHAFGVSPVAGLVLKSIKVRSQLLMHAQKIRFRTHWTLSVTHSDVTLDVEGGTAGEPESLHVGEHLSLVHAGLAPRTAESADQLLVDGATKTETESTLTFCLGARRRV